MSATKQQQSTPHGAERERGMDMSYQLFKGKSSLDNGNTTLYAFTTSKEKAKEIFNGAMCDEFYNTWVVEETEEYEDAWYRLFLDFMYTKTDLDSIIETLSKEDEYYKNKEESTDSSTENVENKCIKRATAMNNDVDDVNTFSTIDKNGRVTITTRIDFQNGYWMDFTHDTPYDWNNKSVAWQTDYKNMINNNFIENLFSILLSNNDCYEKWADVNKETN